MQGYDIGAYENESQTSTTSASSLVFAQQERIRRTAYQVWQMNMDNPRVNEELALHWRQALAVGQLQFTTTLPGKVSLWTRLIRAFSSRCLRMAWFVLGYWQMTRLNMFLKPLQDRERERGMKLK